MPWARRISKPIPAIRSVSDSYELNDYSEGMNTFIGNDLMPVKNGGSNFWRLAQDARITTLGEYGTRKGFDNYNVDNSLAPVSAASIVTRSSSTGAADQNVGGVNYIAQPFTTVGAVRMVQAYFYMKNANNATGVPIVELWTDNAGVPSTMVARTSINPASITSSYTYVPANFASAPSLSATTKYHYVMYIQAGGSGNYNWRSTTTNTDALTSVNSGVSYSSNSFGMNFYNYGTTSTGVIGLHSAVKSDGTTKTVFANDTQVGWVNGVGSSVTAIKTGLNASASNYRFVTVNDIVYYVNGFDGLRKWDFTTESQVNATDYSHICVHKGLLFLVEVDNPNRIVWSNFGVYETFTSTDFLEVPAPKTGDPITALVSLNGYLLIFTRKNKYILSGDDNSNFRLDEAPDQKGTFSQETTTQDQNFVYYLSDDGVYRSNGNEAQLLSKNIYQDILDITNKGTSCMVVNRGRLYLWYAEDGSAVNNRCWVWNLNYSGRSDTVESLDTDAYVSRAISFGNDEDTNLIVGNAYVGTVHWQELLSNDYNNMGGDINFRLETHHMHFGSPSVLKEIRRWIIRVSAQSANYDIDPQYAYDLRSSFQSIGSLGVQGSGYTWGDSGTVWGSFTWGNNAEWQFTKIVPGEYRRFAFAYVHYAARQPQTFLGHTFVYQLRRIR